MTPKALSNLALNTARDEAFSASLGNPFQCLATLTEAIIGGKVSLVIQIDDRGTDPYLQLKLGMGLCGKPVKHKEQQKARKFRQCSQGGTQTWIITCFCLQLLLLNPLVKAQSSCGNPVTDDVNDITKLVGNLPNDYMITLKYVPKMDSLKFSDISDMSDVLSNYSIINNLTRIINDLMACLAFDKNKDFVKENGHLYEEGHFIPEDFFRHFNNTIEVYKEFADILDKNDCILPSTVKTPENVWFFSCDLTIHPPFELQTPDLEMNRNWVDSV
ncbi:kit ligand [Amazona aestiva]|uniref:Kit ligand n=1 Tax=Amazona aestiva TaxID=12930 RepID=A0A0Q3LU11_AMAAE|nr:kit ligand [Amazona aestiva]